VCPAQEAKQSDAKELNEGRWGENGANQCIAGVSRLAAASLDVDYNGQDFWSKSGKRERAQNSDYFFSTDPVTDAEREALRRNKCFRLQPAPLADGLQSQLR
jgi:hypothetical protein